MFDVMQAILWSLTYLLIIVMSVRNREKKQYAIPQIAVLLNFAWESMAIIHSGGFWIHILWFTLDLFIYIYTLSVMPTGRRKWYVLLTVLAWVVCDLIKDTLAWGMLFSCFVIDGIMALSFWSQRKKLLPCGRSWIAGTKLLGDLAAGIYYAPYDISIHLIATGVFIINTTYLVWCIFDQKKQKEDFALNHITR